MNDKKYSLRPYLLAYKWHYAIGIFVLLAVDLANLYIPQFIGEIIDGITAGKLDMAGVGGIIFKILITGLISWRALWMEIFHHRSIKRNRIQTAR